MPKIAEEWKSLPPHTRAPFVLRGAPDDRGVLHVGGRVGAKAGPQAVRRILGNMTTGQHESWRPLLDPGSDLMLRSNLRETYQDFVHVLEKDFREGRTPLVIGGGHDYAYPMGVAANRAFANPQSWTVINLDAHFDLRALAEEEQPNSGSPFFLLIEEGHLKPQNLIEIGIQEHANDISLFQYAKKKKIQTHLLSQCRRGGSTPGKFVKTILARLKSQKRKVLFSIDMDALQMAFAPGVSAPQADGFTATEYFEILDAALSSRVVSGWGFFELNPLLDRDDATARLVALSIHRIVCASQRF